MAIIYKEDLSSSSLNNKLEECSQKSLSLLNAINEFNSTSKEKLQGLGYDAVRKKLSLYEDALQKQSKICDNLSSALRAANNTMSNYMQEYSMLDDSLVPELEISISESEKKLQWLESYVTKEEFDDEIGQMISVNIRNGSESEISSYKDNIEKLKECLELLKNLQPSVNDAWSNMSDIVGDISSYSSAIDSINPTIF